MVADVDLLQKMKYITSGDDVKEQRPIAKPVAGLKIFIGVLKM
jgi:hypothetical protein